MVTSLIKELTDGSAEFRELWDGQLVEVSPSTTKRIDHPTVGRIELDCEALHDPWRDQWVIIFIARLGTPAHDALQLIRVLGSRPWIRRDNWGLPSGHQ